jgi:predicted transcriptional regulator
MPNKPKTQNDKAWESLFKKYDILNQIDLHGQFTISASKIKEYREPRLMAKFDHDINLPDIFASNKLAILPVSRGDYIISHFEAYQPFNSIDEAITRVNFPEHIQSIDPNNVPSETIAINCALVSGMLEDFLCEERLYPTVSGRMRSGNFSFSIQNSKAGNTFNVQVNNAQIEIDAAFEGFETLSLLEAKRDISDDFLVRQLYYPFRLWQSRVEKKVKPIFLVYTNGIYSLYEYEFQKLDSYNSLALVKQKRYSIEDTNIEMSDLMDVAKQITKFATEPQIPFPQANSFERVINLCELLETHKLSKDAVTEKYAFDTRQTTYYTDATRYLGLVIKQKDNRKPVYELSDLGKRIMRLNYKQRQLALCKQILSHKVFHEVFYLCQSGSIPDKTEIVSIMKRSNLYNIGTDNTYARRASTIIGWINWILGIIT